MFNRKNRDPAPVKPQAAAQAKPVLTAKSSGKLVYEARRAEKAGMGLEKWMAEKERRAEAEREAIQRARRKAAPGREAQTGKPGLLRRLLDRAHRPL